MSNQTTTTSFFDVIVVGGGHAGIEAAHAAANMGAKTLLVTLSIEKIGWMPCNPAVGGIGKGHMVYEISALGGLMPKLCTKTYLQARMLNTSKGPAVQGLRLQIDKHAYNTLSVQTLKNLKNLTLLAAMVEQVHRDEQGVVCGITTTAGERYNAGSVVLTTGTFLNGLVHVGQVNHPAGRQGEQTVTALTHWLKSTGLRMGRLKTGTPPRLLRSSIDFSCMEYQAGDDLEYLFEFYPHKTHNSHPCYITHTNQKTHEIIQQNLHLSAMYSGNIKGIGPRYCPSIEDKISRFPNKDSHHIFVEPEGADSDEIYPNGISTSLPVEVQLAYVRSVVGFENAVIVRPGYAVEYDFVEPNQLLHSLEVKAVPGLFLAGQINGTTGYEEAAGQGLVAGINAACKALGKPPFVLERTESYIGIMIDDLITFGVDEPYRMFTSRAEHRLILRQDNAFARLTQYGYDLGTVDEHMYRDVMAENALVAQVLANVRARYSEAAVLKLFGEIECNKQAIVEAAGCALSERAIQTIYAEVRYAPYLKREAREIQKAQQYKNLVIPVDFVYKDVPGLSKELQEKLARYQPQTIDQASRVQGMTPAALAVLIFKASSYAKASDSAKATTDRSADRRQVEGC